MASTSGSNAAAPASARRLQKEIRQIVESPPPGCAVTVDEANVYRWQAIVDGPEGTPFAGGRFPVSIDIPMDYPFKPPTLTFRCKVYHPNITDDGAVCIALLKSDAWKPSTQVADVLRSVVALLVEPNADDALVGEIAEVFRKDGARFEATAREWTRKFAQ